MSKLTNCIRLLLEESIAPLPDVFFSTFDYTQTGKNLTHPITLGLLAQILTGLDIVSTLGIDVRLNLGNRRKFQPDLVGFDENLNPTLFVDYESPNSSDERIPTKDIQAYSEYSKSSGKSVPYIIIVTLPDCHSPRWELRWTSKDQWNSRYKGQTDQVCRSPFQFWSKQYRRLINKNDMKNISLLYVDRKRVRELRI